MLSLAPMPRRATTFEGTKFRDDVHAPDRAMPEVALRNRKQAPRRLVSVGVFCERSSGAPISSSRRRMAMRRALG